MNNVDSLSYGLSSAISTVIIFFIQTFLVVAGIATFFYLLWGAFDWIISGGDREKIAQARAKMMHAVIGLILTIVALSVFVLLATDILHIMRLGPNGEWLFNIMR